MIEYILIIIGLTLSLFTSIAIYKPNSIGNHFFPDICEDGSCKKIIFAKNARLFFNIPNSVFGVLYYIMLLVNICTIDTKWVMLCTILPAIVSCVLCYRIFFVHNAFCKICITTHFVNLALFSLYLTDWNV